MILAHYLGMPLDLLFRMPGIFLHPGCRIGADLDFEFFRLSAGEHSHALLKMSLQIKVCTRLEPFVQRRCLLKAIKLQVTYRILIFRDITSVGNDVQAGVIKCDAVRLDSSGAGC